MKYKRLALYIYRKSAAIHKKVVLLHTKMLQTLYLEEILVSYILELYIIYYVFKPDL